MVFMCPSCNERLKAVKVGPFWKVKQSIVLDCSACGWGYTFYEIYDREPQLTKTAWLTRAADGTEYQEYYRPRKHDDILSTVQQLLKQTRITLNV